MKWDQVKDSWPFVSKEVGRKWGRFTKEDFVMIAGSRESLIRIFELRYGDDHSAAEVKVDGFIEGLSFRPELQMMLAWPRHLWFGVTRHFPFRSRN